MAAYVVFKSVHDVMKMEAVLKNTELQFKLVPVPRKISESCGIAVMLDEHAVEEFKQIAEATNSVFEDIIALDA